MRCNDDAIGRLTYEKPKNRWDGGKHPTKYTSRHTFQEVVDRLAAYEDAMPLERAQELAQAEKDGRLVVLEPAAREGEKKPPCFYNDMGQDLCLGFARGEYDDEPIDGCKECWYCESTREEAEAVLKKREEADNEAD